MLELNGEWHAKEVQSRGERPELGWQHRLPRAWTAFVQGNWSSFVSVGFPIINDLNGIQSEPDIRIVTGRVFTF